MLSAAIGAILSVVASIGLTHIEKLIQRKAEEKTVEEQNDPVFLGSLMQEVYSNARSLGSTVVAKLNDKLAAITGGVLYQNPTMKKYITQAANAVREKASKVSGALDEYTNRVANVEQRVNAFNTMSNEFKNSEAGKKMSDQLKSEADEMNKKGNKFIENLRGDNYEKTV